MPLASRPSKDSVWHFNILSDFSKIFMSSLFRFCPLFFDLPSHQIVSIFENHTCQSFLDSMHTVAPEVITIGIIDFHLRKPILSFTCFWAFHLAMGSPLRIFPPNHLEHFSLLLLHFSTALWSQRSLRKVWKQFPVLLLQFVDNLEEFWSLLMPHQLCLLCVLRCFVVQD